MKVHQWSGKDRKGTLPWGNRTYQDLMFYFRNSGSAVRYTIHIETPDLVVVERKPEDSSERSVWAITP